MMINFKDRLILFLTSVIILLCFLHHSSRITSENRLVARSYVDEVIEDFDRDHIKMIYSETIKSLYENTEQSLMDWDRLAYFFYATSPDHLCNAMMMMTSLKDSNTRAKMVVLTDQEFFQDKFLNATMNEFSLKNSVLFKPVEIQSIKDKGYSGDHQASFTKLLVFNETEYDRIIYLDADATLPNGNLDELFSLPPVKLAAPAAWWSIPNRVLDDVREDDGSEIITREKRDERISAANNIFATLTNRRLNRLEQQSCYNELYNSLPTIPQPQLLKFTSMLMVIQPSPKLFETIFEAMDLRAPGEFDMEVLNKLVFRPEIVLKSQKRRMKKMIYYGEYNNDNLLRDTPDLLILPHQQYGALSGEFNSISNHEMFLVDTPDIFDMNLSFKNGYHKNYDNLKHSLFQNIKYYHFTESNMPRPWETIDKSAEYWKTRPRCKDHEDYLINQIEVIEDCKAGEFWDEQFNKFQALRLTTCKQRGEPLDPFSEQYKHILY